MASSAPGWGSADRPVLLLVDDSPEFAFLVTRLGERAGCVVLACPDTQSALEQIRKACPDLILLDRNLGGQDGLDLIREVRQTLGDVPTALFCHASISADQAEAVEAGVDFFFHKDLVSRPSAWEHRLFEILSRTAGRDGKGRLESAIDRWRSARSPGEGLPGGHSGPEGAEGLISGTGARMSATREQTPYPVPSLGKALQHPMIRGIGLEVLRVLVRRGLEFALEGRPSERRPDIETVLGPDLDVDQLDTICSPQEADRLFAYLTDRMVGLLGGGMASAFHQVLGPDVPPASPPGREGPARGPRDRGSMSSAGQDPASTVSPSRSRDGTPPATSETDPGPSGQGRLGHAVLLVEDNEPEIAITQRAIRQCGLPLELFVVRDGLEAMDYLLRQGTYRAESRVPWRFPDLILLDLNLPRLDGREVLRRIRAHPQLRAAPVVVLSNSRRPEEVRDLYASGANTYIEKPHDFARFVEVLRTIHHYWLGTALLPAPP